MSVFSVVLALLWTQAGWLALPCDHCERRWKFCDFSPCLPRIKAHVKLQVPVRI